MLDCDCTLVVIYSKSKLKVISDLSTFCIAVMTVKTILLKCVKLFNMVFLLLFMCSRIDEKILFQ